MFNQQHSHPLRPLLPKQYEKTKLKIAKQYEQTKKKEKLSRETYSSAPYIFYMYVCRKRVQVKSLGPGSVKTK